MAFSKILVIDDSKPDRYLVKRYLESENLGQEVLEAANGEEGLILIQKIIEENSVLPQVIFLDIDMPVIGGFEFLDKFDQMRAQNKPLGLIKIIMYSSSDNQENKEKAVAYENVQGFIAKHPGSSKELKKQMSVLLPEITES